MSKLADDTLYTPSMIADIGVKRIRNKKNAKRLHLRVRTALAAFARKYFANHDGMVCRSGYREYKAYTGKRWKDAYGTHE